MTVAIERKGVQLGGVLVDSGSTCNAVDRETWKVLKKRKIKCKSWNITQEIVLIWL